MAENIKDLTTWFHIVIPARYASQRFPSKVNADLGVSQSCNGFTELSVEKQERNRWTVATDQRSW